MATIDIGPASHDEDCAQIGLTEDAERVNGIECRAYIAALRAVHGPEPEGAALVAVENVHDFGTYREVALRTDRDDEAVHDYARRVQDGVATWAQAGMEAPVSYGPRGQVLGIAAEAPPA